MSYEAHIRKEYRPYIQSLADDIRARRNPNFFWPTGTQVYVGRQGSGKTISAVHHIRKLKARYPKAILVSNLQFLEWEAVPVSAVEEIENALALVREQPGRYLLYTGADELARVLTQVNNGFYGVIYVIDEIHTYFNALESKDMPMYVFTEISQQRKQRKLIVGTSQLFMRMAKPLREQCDNLIMCNTIMGILTVQKVYDGMTLEQDYDGSLIGKQKKMGFFFHNREIRGAFDTFQKVVSGAVQFEEQHRLFVRPEKKGFLGRKKN